MNKNQGLKFGNTLTDVKETKQPDAVTQAKEVAKTAAENEQLNGVKSDASSQEALDAKEKEQAKVINKGVAPAEGATMSDGRQTNQDEATEAVRLQNAALPPEVREGMGAAMHPGSTDSNAGITTQNADKSAQVLIPDEQNGGTVEDTAEADEDEVTYTPYDDSAVDPEDQKVSFSSTTQNLNFTDEFKFENGILKLEPARAAVFEQLLELQPLHLKYAVTRIPTRAEAEELLKKNLLNRGRMIPGMDSTANSVGPRG